jgi:hypothetical protein
MAPFDPGNARHTEYIGQSRFEIQRLPLSHGIQVLDEFRQEAHSEPLNAAARFVPGLVLIETPVGIPRGLADVQSP